MRRLATLALAFTMAAAACGGTTPSGSTTPTGGAPADMSALAPAKDVAPAATLTWWHAMSGVNGDAVRPRSRSRPSSRAPTTTSSRS